VGKKEGVPFLLWKKGRGAEKKIASQGERMGKFDILGKGDRKVRKTPAMKRGN